MTEFISIRTHPNMDVALDRVCQRRADCEKHEFRKKVAEAIIRSVKRGNTSLAVLTAAGERVIPSTPSPVIKKKSA